MQLSLLALSCHIAVPAHLTFPRSQFSGFTSRIFECTSLERGKVFTKSGVLTLRSGFKQVISSCCRCDTSDDGFDLEHEILDSTTKSENPTTFPTKQELVSAGRTDLVEAIKKAASCNALGGDDQEETGLDFEDSLKRVESYIRRVSSNKNSNPGNLNFQHLTTPAALDAPQAKEIGADETTDVNHVLSKLEKLSSDDLAIILQHIIFKYLPKMEDGVKDQPFDASLDVGASETVKDGFELGQNGSVAADFHHNGALNTSNGKCSPDIKPESWRTWSSIRAGLDSKDFQAAEINYSRNHDEESHHGETTLTTEEYGDDRAGHKKLHYSEIRNRTRNLESELFSALRSFRSEWDRWVSEKGPPNSSKPFDARKLQDEEIKIAQRKLRSVEAMATILERGMVAAAIEGHEKLSARLRNVNGITRAMKLLQTRCIVWPFPASEVLLAGSFDGWSTQRRMERSDEGMFSVCLLMYPGRYEIKFIVDGVWKVDPLRQVVFIGGYENNLFVVT